MAAHKYIDRICLAGALLSLLVSLLFMNGEALGLQAASQVMGYEAKLFDTSRVHTIDIIMDDCLSVSSLNKSIQKHDNEWTVNLTQNTASDKNRSGVFVYLLDTVARRGPPISPLPPRRLCWMYPPSPRHPIAQPGLPVKGKAAATRRCSAPLTGCPGCATSQGATGDISSRAAPFPWIGKGRGDRVEPLPPQTAVFPRLICGQLAISKLCPARVSGPGFIGAGIVSFPRPDLSEYCQHLNLLNTLTGANAVLLSYANGKIEELDARRQQLIKEIAALNAETISPQKIEFLSAHLENWNTIDFDDRRQVTDIILSQVQATSDRVSFEWKI